MHAAESVAAGEIYLHWQTPEGHNSRPEKNRSMLHLESEDNASTVQEPLPSQPTPVLSTMTDVTPACYLLSTVKDLLRYDEISLRNAPKISIHLQISMALVIGLMNLTSKKNSTLTKCLLSSDTVKINHSISRQGRARVSHSQVGSDVVANFAV